MAYLPDGSSVLSGCGKGILHFWDPRTGKERRSFPTRETALHALALSPDGRRIAGAGKPDAIAIWDSSTGKELGHQEDPDAWIGADPHRLSYSPDGSILIIMPDTWCLAASSCDTGWVAETR